MSLKNRGHIRDEDSSFSSRIHKVEIAITAPSYVATDPSCLPAFSFSFLSTVFTPMLQYKIPYKLTI